MVGLEDLGLSEYETRAYRALLDAGPTTAKELSRTSGVPMGRIYDVLNSIERRGLVRSQTAGRPKKYAAVEPSTALDRLLEAKKRDFDEQIERFESMVDELAADLEVAEPVEEQFWTAAVGPRDSVRLLLERLDAANTHLVVVASDPSPQLDVDAIGTDVLGHLEDALDRGVSVDLLLRRSLVSSLSSQVGERYRSGLQERADFDVRTHEHVSGTFNVIDGVEVCIEVPNPLGTDELFGTIDLKDPEFASEVVSEFEPRWAEADPLVI